MVGTCINAVEDVDPISCLAVSSASCLLSSLVIATVLVVVVGIGLTALLKVDNLPRDGVLIVPTISVVGLGKESVDVNDLVMVGVIVLIVVIG